MAANENNIEVALMFNGGDTVQLSTTVPKYKTLLEAMFKNTKAWQAELTEAGNVVLKPATGVGKVEQHRDSQ